MNRDEQFAPGDALLVVDVQNDFCSGGALAVRDADAVVPLINRWIEAARGAGIPIFACRDWHPAGHVSFRERGGPWPPHCVQGTHGAEFHPALRLPPDAPVTSKGSDLDHDSYSAFEGVHLVEQLRHLGIRRLWIGGLTLDYCVRHTVRDAIGLGFEARVIREATRAVDATPGDGDRALAEMRAAGATIVETSP